jgi:hypothetical protein
VFLTKIKLYVMRKKLGIITSHCFSKDVPLYQFNANEFRRYCCNNTGNIVINHLGTKLLDYECLPCSSLSADDDREFLILYANGIRPGHAENYEWWDKFFHVNDDIPLHMMGVGTQIGLLSNMTPKEYSTTIKPEMCRWLSQISERVASIGVRGEFTADVLRCLGIQNIDVIGCPTYFANGYNQPEIVKKDWSENLKGVFATWEAGSNQWERNWSHFLLKQMMRLSDPCFVMQSEFQFVPYMVANQNIWEFVKHFSYRDLKVSMRAICSHFGIRRKELVRNKTMRHMFKMFSNVDRWAEFMRTRDFSLSFRIHGTIMALKNGVPACCICTDHRTLELCETLKIPHIKVTDIESSDLSVQKIYEECDIEETNKQYNSLLANYKGFLEKNKIANIL